MCPSQALVSVPKTANMPSDFNSAAVRLERCFLKKNNSVEGEHIIQFLIQGGKEGWAELLPCCYSCYGRCANDTLKLFGSRTMLLTQSFHIHTSTFLKSIYINKSVLRTDIKGMFRRMDWEIVRLLKLEGMRRDFHQSAGLCVAALVQRCKWGIKKKTKNQNGFDEKWCDDSERAFLLIGTTP